MRRITPTVLTSILLAQVAICHAQTLEGAIDFQRAFLVVATMRRCIIREY